ncbi:lytic transglycosylase domain-containing protein [Actinokineospora globicatena]|uniref:lytic transglycosylase domain-containing protein n=1 Tax=Actinokineospora globicatena TaxID=103729 RepID=UPI0020A25E69|nr:lytic transglycosylase domain-containing protein [Actinokineospora globicatena]
MAASPTPQPTTLSIPLEPAPGPRRRRGVRVVARLALVAFLVALAAGTVILLDGGEEQPPPQRFAVVEVPVRRGEVPPHAEPVPTDDVAGWASRVSAATDIPRRTLLAYATAETATRQRLPQCNLTWVTLAGVGRVESHHGRYGGTRVGDDGKLSKPIIGVPLDGSPGVQAIPDTDDGTLDGDPQWDRAVGSMQFLPTTWSRFGLRAAPDGARPDPQNVDDSALTAANYLCTSGGDLATGPGWWKAVLTYNESTRYAQSVYSGAAAYARKAAELA